MIESIGLYAQIKANKKVLINEQELHEEKGATTRNNEWQRKPLDE